MSEKAKPRRILAPWDCSQCGQQVSEFSVEHIAQYWNQVNTTTCEKCGQRSIIQQGYIVDVPPGVKIKPIIEKKPVYKQGEEIAIGCLQRIANATEKIALGYDNMRVQRDNMQRFCDLLKDENAEYARRLAATKGVVSKLKKRLEAGK